MLKHTSIDPEQCSIEELKSEIQRLEREKTLNRNLEQALKVDLNSFYGVMGNPYFVGYDINVASSVTAMGQSMNIYMSQRYEQYFLKEWHLDLSTHEKMGIKVLTHVLDSVIIYMHTDSIYFNIDVVIKSTDFKGEAIDFMLLLNEHLFARKSAEILEDFAKQYLADNINPFNGKPFQEFEFEKFSRAGLWLGKNQYILDIIFKMPNASYKPLTKISPTGVDMAKGTVSKFVRAKMKELVVFIFKYDGKIMEHFDEFLKLLRSIKSEFTVADVEDICMSASVGKLNDYIDLREINGQTEILVRSGAPVYVKAAGNYNYLLQTHKDSSRLKTKYPFIRNGDKIKYYQIKDNAHNFAFLGGQFPHEFAPPVDRMAQFEKIFLSVVNRFCAPLDVPEMDKNLTDRNQLLIL